MAKLAAFPEPMNVEQFLSFYDTRPHGEKWELIDGELFMNATPVNFHQLIVANILAHLHGKLRREKNQFRVSPGLGIRLSAFSSVEPDVMVRPRDSFNGRNCEDIVVAFEVLSPSTRNNDLKFKRDNYPALASLSHYVVVSAERMEVRVYARSNNWAESLLLRTGDSIEFATLQVKLTLAEIYDDMADLMESPAP